MTVDDIANITTIKSALTWARTILIGAAAEGSTGPADTVEIDDAPMEARILLSHVMAVGQNYLMTYPERTLTVAQANNFQTLVARRAKGEPIAYLLGKKGFYDIEVFVTPDVLISRPETELLVEKAIAWAKEKSDMQVVDMGTGSGIIALVLAKHLPNAHVIATDISKPALHLVKHNAHHLKLQDRVKLIHGNFLEPLIQSGQKADLIVANLPYIATDELEKLPVAKHEPRLALDGGKDGLEPMRRFLKQAPQVIKPGGLILMEIGYDQGEAVVNLAKSVFPDAQISVQPDLAGHDRLVSIQT